MLRECTYLPPAIRPVFQTSVQQRFRDNIKDDHARAEKHWKRAQNLLRVLRAANRGHGLSMNKLIYKAFGREGYRRRKLMAAFVRLPVASNSDQLEALMSGDANSTAPGAGAEPAKKNKKKRSTAGDPKNRFHLNWDRTKLISLLSSHRQRQGESKSTSHLLGSAIKALNPDVEIPKLNIWGYPPPECVANAKRARWWRRNADKMMPPLCNGEWELLGQLSRGAQETDEWRKPPPRAAAVSTRLVGDGNEQQQQQQQLADATVEEEEEKRAELLRYVSQGAWRVEKERSMKFTVRSGKRDIGPYGFSPSESGLSARWFRRTYNRAWAVAPKMELDPATSKYKFTWGTLPGARIREATAKQKFIFEGVDAKGQPLNKPPAK